VDGDPAPIFTGMRRAVRVPGPAVATPERAGPIPTSLEVRRYERDVGGEGWHDGLLMELLAGDEM